MSSTLQPDPTNTKSSGVKKRDVGELKMTETRKWPSSDKVFPNDLEKIGFDGGRSPADSVDKASRVLFPALFVIYNIVYWAVYALPG